MIKAVMIVQTEINHSASDGENLLQQITVVIALIKDLTALLLTLDV